MKITATCPLCHRIQKTYKDGRMVRHGFFGNGAECWGSGATQDVDIAARITLKETVSLDYARFNLNKEQARQDVIDYARALRKLNGIQQ